MPHPMPTSSGCRLPTGTTTCATSSPREHARHLPKPGLASQNLCNRPDALPPENTTDRDQVADDVDKLINVNAPIPDTGQLTTARTEARANLALNHRMLVVDAATGATLYDVGGQDAIVPASTLKLFTAINTLHHLDTSHRFTTSATYDPAQGVTLIGGGDGLLSNGESTGETVGYAGLADLANKTWEAIQQDVAQSGVIDVRVDVSRYAQPFTHPTWTEGLMTGGWVSPVYPLNTWGGFVTDPQLASEAVEDGAAYATAAFAQRLTEAAAQAGYDVEFSNAGRTTQPTETAPVASVQSATLGEQLRFAMKHSNNMLCSTRRQAGNPQFHQFHREHYHHPARARPRRNHRC